MEKVVKVETAKNAYDLLNSAKLTKMAMPEKFAVIEALRELKKVATDFEGASKDAFEKLKADGFEERLQTAQQYESAVKEGKEELPMSKEDYTEFVKEFVELNNNVRDAVKTLSEAEVTLTFEALSKDGFGNLLESNDTWDANQIMLLMEVVCA